MQSKFISIVALSFICMSTTVACDKKADDKKADDKKADDKKAEAKTDEKAEPATDDKAEPATDDKAGSGKTVQAIDLDTMEDGKEYTRDLAFIVAQEVSGEHPILLHFDDADKVRVNMYPAEGLAYDKLVRGTVYSVTFDHSNMGMPVAKKIE